MRPTLGQSLRETDRFSLVLVMILVSVIVSAAVGSSRIGSFATVVLLGVTLLVAQLTSQAGRRAVRLTIGLVIVVLVVATVANLAGGDQDLPRAIDGIILSFLILLTATVIARRLLMQQRIDGSTVSAALCIYLLLGLFFAFVYVTMDALAGPFFAEPSPANVVDFVYFSYVTQATVGFGDLTPKGDLARMLTVAEGLIGQIYLVTVVALLVGNLGSERPEGPERPLRVGRRRGGQEETSPTDVSRPSPSDPPGT